MPWTPETDPATPWTPEAPPGLSLAGRREFQAQFDTPTFEGRGVSLVRRPDAVSLDYLTAFSSGPVNIGDSAHGSFYQPWYARATAGAVYIARTNDARTAWLAETQLFTYAGAPIAEVDIAFEQAGRAVIAAERAGHLWLYWFNSVSGLFEFTDFGPGRTPRILLDNPPDLTNSDVVVFYFNDVTGFLCYRMQRERYQTEHTTPIAADVNRFVEEAAVGRDNRVHVYWSERDVVHGTYTFHVLETQNYPYATDPDRMRAGFSVNAGDMEKVVLLINDPFDVNDGYIDGDRLLAALGIPSGALVLPLVRYGGSDADAGWPTSNDDRLLAALGIPSGTLLLPIIKYGGSDASTGFLALFEERLNAALALPSGALVVVIIDHSMYQEDRLNADLSIPSGSLIIP